MFLWLINCANLLSQTNLIPNYSFEEKDSCGMGWRAIDLLCKDWFTPMKYLDTAYNPYTPNNYGSSEYYNKCNIPDFSVPNNLFGYQLAKTGKAYAGFGLLVIHHPPNYPYHNKKEYIEVMLKSGLSQNRKYCVEFYYSIANWTTESFYFPITIGALITDTLVKRKPSELYYFTDIHANAQIRQRLPNILDTLNWIKVSGTFTAKGGEKYLTIGNFDNTDTIYKPGIYVLIEDVKLWYCGADTSREAADTLIIPNVFTPNGDGYNDVFNYKNQQQWDFETQIYNRWGELLFSANNTNWDGYYKGKKVSEGVYFYKITAKAIETEEIRVYNGAVHVFY